MLRKVYNDEVDIINREQPPTTLAFWPDFEHPDWHWHFAYYGGNLQQHFAPRMFVSPKTMAAFIAADEGPAARVRRAEQLVREPHFLAEQLPLSQTSALAELYRSESAPEALYCDCVIDQRAPGFVDSKARTPVGMLLLPAPKRSAANPVSTSALSIPLSIGRSASAPSRSAWCSGTASCCRLSSPTTLNGQPFRNFCLSPMSIFHS
jgi:hypothetical protein